MSSESGADVMEKLMRAGQAVEGLSVLRKLSHCLPPRGESTRRMDWVYGVIVS